MKKILVVEDNLEMRENTAELLALSGYEVTTAENGKLGAEKALAELPDLILCDIMMPELDGYGMLYILNKHPKTANIPFVFLSAKSEKEDFRKGMSLGANDYVTKPFDELELLKAVETRLKKSQETSKHKTSLNPKLADLPFWENAREIMLGKKETLFMEGESANHVYYLQEGYIKEFKTNRLGKEFITRLMKSDQFIGLEALLNNIAHSTTAQSLRPVRIKAISKHDFMATLKDQPALANFFYCDMARHVLEFQDRILTIAYDSVKRRLAQTLLFLQSFFEQGDLDCIPLTREEIANVTGTTVETAIRTLSQFKKEGHISYEQEGVKVLDQASLRGIKN